MKIIVKQYQASLISTLISTIKERMLGWCKEDQSFYFKEADSTEFGSPKRIPSIIGNGTNVKITVPGHTIIKDSVIRLNDAGFYTSAASSVANTSNATHFVFDVVGDDLYLTQKGSWKVENLTRGRVYLSTSANALTSAYTGIEQSVGIYDGTYLHLNFNENKTTQKYNKILTIGSPIADMDYTLLYTSKPTSLLLIKSVINGTGTINVTVSYSPNRDMSGTTTEISTQSVTSTTTGDVFTLAVTNIPVDNYVVLKINSVVGSPESLETVIIYEEQ
jgi:hypothetical protein